jgi:hypothetical protein
MAEEKQEEKKEEQTAKPEKPAKAEKPKEIKEAKEEKPASESEKKRKKISEMTLPEVEAGLKIAQEKMGGFQSGFARNLLARKKILLPKL